MTHQAAVRQADAAIADAGNPARNTRWVTAAALRALAGQPLLPGASFSSSDLDEWLAGALDVEQRQHATTKLCELGFVTQRWQLVKGERVSLYTLTSEGAAALAGTRTGQERKSGPKVGRRGNPPSPDQFSARLWQLLRMRRMLTPREGATLLCDAGSDIDKARKTAAKCLNRWAKAGAVEAGKRRVRAPDAPPSSNGDKRYVLVIDRVDPPTWHKPRSRRSTAVPGESP